MALLNCCNTTVFEPAGKSFMIKNILLLLEQYLIVCFHLTLSTPTTILDLNLNLYCHSNTAWYKEQK